MSGQIVSANVGASAGGNVIPLATDPSYATYPDMLKKTSQDLISILERNYDKQMDDGDSDSIDNPELTNPSSGTIVENYGGTPHTKTGLNPMLLLVGAVIFLLVIGRGLKL